MLRFQYVQPNNTLVTKTIKIGLVFYGSFFSAGGGGGAAPVSSYLLHVSRGQCVFVSDWSALCGEIVLHRDLEPDVGAIHCRLVVCSRHVTHVAGRVVTDAGSPS